MQIRVHLWGCNRTIEMLDGKMFQKCEDIYRVVFPVKSDLATFIRYLMDGQYILFEYCNMNSLQPIAFCVVNTITQLSLEDGCWDDTGLEEKRNINEECTVEVYGWDDGNYLGNADISLSIIPAWKNIS